MEGDSGSPALRIEMTVACLNMSGKIPVVKHFFIILHGKGDGIEAFHYMRCTGILSLFSLVFFKLLIKETHSFSETGQKSSEDIQFEFTQLTGSIVECFHLVG